MGKVWREMKAGFWIAAGIFSLGLLCGAALPSLAPELAIRIMDLVNSEFKPILSRMGQRGAGYDIILVFLHNLQAAMAMIVLGFTVVYPALSIFANGSVVGIVLVMAHRVSGLHLGQFFLLILPHGIFELPALFMAAAIAWRLWSRVRRLIVGRESTEALQSFILTEAFHSLLFTIGLLALASFMEISVSAAFADRFRHSLSGTFSILCLEGIRRLKIIGLEE